MKAILSALLTIILLAGCIPLGSEIKSISIVGKSQGQVIERLEINKKFVVVISPEGFFHRGYLTSVEYWLKEGNSKVQLSHLDRLNRGRTLREMLGVNSSPLWVAFDLGEVTRESVQINIVVFDRNGIRHVQSIADCKRLDLCAEHFLSMQSYAITSNDNNTFLSIETLSSSLVYDVMNGKLKERERRS